jgi:beta-galactosidase
MMGFHYDQIDYYRLAQNLDLVSWDNYLRTSWNRDDELDASTSALGHDTMRGLKRANYWVMEQQAGSGGWQEVGAVPRPGEMRLWTYQAIAHGADAIVYFRWRTARYGTEQFWHGVLDHHGGPRRRYRELQSIGEEIKRLGWLLQGAQSKSKAAMILSYDSRFAFQGQPNHSAFWYATHFHNYYKALHRRNIVVDIVPPTAELGEYEVVLAPALYVLSQEAAENLQRYVENGGTLLVTTRSGVKDETNAVVNLPLPGLLADICGVEVDEYDALHLDAKVPLELTLPGNTSTARAEYAQLWCDVLAPINSQTVARYQGEYYEGRAAITLNRFGHGQAVYVGTLGDENLIDTVVGWLVEVASVSPVLHAPEGVEAVERWQGERCLLFVLNHTDRTQRINLPQPSTDLLNDRMIEGEITLGPKDVMILRKV